MESLARSDIFHTTEVNTNLYLWLASVCNRSTIVVSIRRLAEFPVPLSSSFEFLFVVGVIMELFRVDTQ